MPEPALLTGWRIARAPDELVVSDPSGAVAARVRPGPATSPPVAGALRVTGLRDRYEALTRAAWVSSAGIPDQQRAVLELPDGSTTSVRNGTLRGPRRRAMDVVLRLDGRRYRYAHTSSQTADVRRDASTIAVAVTGSARRPAGARRCAVAPGVDVDVRSALDRADELALVVFLGLCGPPGRPGAVRRIAGAIWADMNNP